MALSEACNSSGCEAAAPERLCVWMPIAHRAWSRAAVAKVRDVACDQNAHPAGTTPSNIGTSSGDDVAERDGHWGQRQLQRRHQLLSVDSTHIVHRGFLSWQCAAIITNVRRGGQSGSRRARRRARASAMRNVFSRGREPDDAAGQINFSPW